MQIVDWWVYGIPAFEKLVIQAQLPIIETRALQSLVQNESFKAIEIHRKGIPRPDFFQLQLTVEPSVPERPKNLKAKKIKTHRNS
jgi:hypothetical protein